MHFHKTCLWIYFIISLNFIEFLRFIYPNAFCTACILHWNRQNSLIILICGLQLKSAKNYGAGLSTALALHSSLLHPVQKSPWHGEVRENLSNFEYYIKSHIYVTVTPIASLRLFWSCPWRIFVENHFSHGAAYEKKDPSLELDRPPTPPTPLSINLVIVFLMQYALICVNIFPWVY